MSLLGVPYTARLACEESIFDSWALNDHTIVRGFAILLILLVLIVLIANSNSLLTVALITSWRYSIVLLDISGARPTILSKLEISDI